MPIKKIARKLFLLGNLWKLLSFTIFISIGFHGNEAYAQTTSDRLVNENVNTLQNENNNYGGTDNPAPGGTTVVGSPSAFANTHLYNSPWNFTPPHLLFHASKTINDHSAFRACRLINLSTNVRDSIKDKFFGVFDEKEFISTGIGRLPRSSPVPSGHIIVCGLNTEIPPSCVTFVGTSYILMENYSSTEAALVGIAQTAAKHGANLVGNLNCPYQETVESFSTGVGAVLDLNKGKDGALGASWDSSRVRRPVQPHCSGDFYVVTTDCKVDSTYFPKPRPYRRYLPPAQPNDSYASSSNIYNQAPVRGYW